MNKINRLSGYSNVKDNDVHFMLHLVRKGTLHYCNNFSTEGLQENDRG